MLKVQTQTIRLLLVDDHAMFREGLSRTFEPEADLMVAGQCGSCAEALPLLAGIGMVLLDVDLGSERALDFVESARRQGYTGHILVLTAGISGLEAVQLIRAGVSGIMHKHHSGQVLCETIRKVAGGEVFLEERYLGSLFQSVDQTRTQVRPALTERDRTVLRYIFQGLTNREIGGHLRISEGAVKASVRQLCDKLSARTRAQLVKTALEQYKDQL